MIGNIAAGLYGVGVPPVTSSYESIATVSVGSGGTSTITFSSIPSTYKHLQIRSINQVSYGSNTYGGLNLRLGNGSVDTGSNYAYHFLRGDGSSASAGAGANPSDFISSGITRLASSDTNTFATVIIDILDYGSTSKAKTIRCLTGVDANGSGYVGMQSGLWTGTSAINTIRLYSNDGNLSANSRFALYGIKD
jgi:hypothetical protein